MKSSSSKSSSAAATQSSKLTISHLFKEETSSDGIKEYAEKRIQKLSKHIHQLANCHFVYLSSGKNTYSAGLHVTSGEFDARAEGEGESFTAAIDDVVDKMVKQSRKFKEKETNHSGKGHHNNE